MFANLRLTSALKKLTSKNWKLRLKAIKALGKLQDRRALEPLSKALHDDEPEVGCAAAAALGRIRHPQTVESLLGALGTSSSVTQTLAEMESLIGAAAAREMRRAVGCLNEKVHVAIIGALASIGDPRAVEPLMKALGQQDRSVRRAAAEALGRFGDPRTVKPLYGALIRDDDEVSAAAASALGILGGDHARSLLTDALNRGWGKAETIIETLGRMKDVQAIEPLIRKLGAKSNIRCAAARALANLGQPKWLQWIRGSENDFNHLWASADSEAKGLLFNTIELSVDAVRTLGTCGDPRAFESLVRALSAGDGDARCAAAKALGKIGDRRAAEPLARALEDCSPLVRERASVALFRIGDSRAIEPLRRLLTTAGKEVVEVLEEVGGSHALDLLPVALRNNKPEVRCRAVRALGKLGDRAALDPLVSALSDPDGDVRRLTVEALAQFDASRAVEPVLRMLSDERSDIRQQAAEVLGQLGDSRAVDPLIAQLCDWRIYRDNERECCSIIDALSKLGDQRAVEPLVRMLGERTSGSRVPRSAAAALATLGHPKWLQWVCGEFDTDFERLGRSEDADACAPLVFALDCPRFSVRMAAARALGMLGEERAVKPLLDCLRGAHGTWDTRLVGEVFRGGSASWCLRKAVATALVQICSRNPRAVAPHWAALAQAVREPHVDSHKDIAGQSDCGTDIHQDRGIGLDFPAPPPGATRPPSVADAATKQAVPKEPVIVCQNPQCQKKFKFAAKLAGRVVKCPACGTSFKVPAQQGGGHDARLDF